MQKAGGLNLIATHKHPSTHQPRLTPQHTDTGRRSDFRAMPAECLAVQQNLHAHSWLGRQRCRRHSRNEAHSCICIQIGWIIVRGACAGLSVEWAKSDGWIVVSFPACDTPCRFSEPYCAVADFPPRSPRRFSYLCGCLAELCKGSVWEACLKELLPGLLSPD